MLGNGALSRCKQCVYGEDAKGDGETVFCWNPEVLHERGIVMLVLNGWDSCKRFKSKETDNAQ